MVNYRGGEQRRPFWSMLSISPIFYRDELMLYVASLQDYSCHMDKLVSLKPSQFCRTLEHHQRGRHVKMPLTALIVAAIVFIIWQISFTEILDIGGL